jgi:CDP-6-deoxy-D-xylo-4-hexulose-3-dehydrase
MDHIMSIAKTHNLLILEDCCEALGATWNGVKVGNFGIGASFSFFFSHHMTTMEGGMITCPDYPTAEQLKILRAHGWLRNVEHTDYDLSAYILDPRYTFINWGFNVRPTDIQAGFGLHQLRKLPEFNQQRKELAQKFFAFIDQTPFLNRPVTHPLAQPSWFALPVIITLEAPFSRKDLMSYLESEGVETRPIVAGNVACHPVSQLFEEFQQETFPGADIIHARGFYVGLSPFHSEALLERLIDCFQQFFRRY